MKKYNTNTYRLYKNDVKTSINSIDHEKDYIELDRDELIVRFLPLVENIAKKFSTSSQASGVMDITDLIQEGSVGLIKAVDRIDWNIFALSPDKEKTIKSFLLKRIRGAIRRSVDTNRSDIRIPEYKLNEIRKDLGKDEKMVAMFFNSIFLSLDDPNIGGQPFKELNKINQIEDNSITSNPELLNVYLLSLLRKHLNSKEYQVLRLSYGLDCEKHSAQDIANIIGLNGSSAHVRVSQLKRQAVDKLIENVDPSHVLDYT
jgi:RNA polymerase sigma factor (sigma-70 family)